MDFETRSLSEVLSFAAASFDPDIWDLEFERSVPIAIYVHSTDEDGSRTIAEIVERRVNSELQELGFESPESLTHYYGSFLQLNLSKAPKTDNGPATESKLRILRRRLAKYLKGEFLEELKQAGKDVRSILKVAIGIGTIVILLTTVPAAGVAVGAFVVSAKTWAYLTVVKEASDVVEQAGKMLTESPEAKAALKKPISDDDPVVIRAVREKEIRELEKAVHDQEKRVQEQDNLISMMAKELRELRARLDEK
jgi:hypothetical protein